jgi:dethiobiotin synthetase
VIVLVAGTGTDVGKTWVTANVAAALRTRGLPVRARKPAQSFAAGDERTDAHVLGAATGERADVVCPRERWYEVPMAPPMAADALGRETFAIADLVAELPGDDEHIIFVESAGGVRSPLAGDGDTVTLAEELRPALVVLVGDAGLGTINAVRLAVAALAPHETIVFLNRFDSEIELHRRNRDWLVAREGYEVVTDPEALVLLLTRRAGFSR